MMLRAIGGNGHADDDCTGYEVCCWKYVAGDGDDDMTMTATTTMMMIMVTAHNVNRVIREMGLVGKVATLRCDQEQSPLSLVERLSRSDNGPVQLRGLNN